MFVNKEVKLKKTITSSSLNGNIYDVVRKRDRILGVVIFIFNISYSNVSYVFVIEKLLTENLHSKFPYHRLK